MENEKERVLDYEPLTKLLGSYKTISSNDLIPLLQQIQLIYGYLPPRILSELSKKTHISASHIFGVATFYEQFYLKPHGRHTIKCCRGTACYVKGGTRINKALQRLLKIKPGETTGDMRFTYETVACLGTCFLAPVMLVDKDYFGQLAEEDLEKILQRYA